MKSVSEYAKLLLATFNDFIFTALSGKGGVKILKCILKNIKCDLKATKQRPEVNL